MLRFLKMTVLLIFIIFTLCRGFELPSFSVNGAVSDRISGGAPIERILDYQVSLRELPPSQVDLSPFKLRHFCAGTLIYPTIVLTAAHCLNDAILRAMREGRIFAVQGTNLIYFNPETTFVSPVEFFEAHPFYENSSNNNTVPAYNLAVLRIRDRVQDNVKAIALRSKETNANENCNATGWGSIYNGEDHPMSDVLMWKNVDTWDLKYCSQMFKQFKLNLTKDAICTGSTIFNEGDYGGPLVCKNELTGVISWSSHSKPPNNYIPAVYASVADSRVWIEKASKKLMDMQVTTPTASTPSTTTQETHPSAPSWSKAGRSTVDLITGALVFVNCILFKM